MPLLAKLLVMLAILPHAQFLLTRIAPSTRELPDLEADQRDQTMSAMSSEALYVVSLGAALALALFFPMPEIARAFAWFWLVSFVAGAAWGAFGVLEEVRLHGVIIGALGTALLHPQPVIAEAFALFGLSCVVVSGLYGAWCGMRRLALYYYSLPAGLALLSVVIAAGQI